MVNAVLIGQNINFTITVFSQQILFVFRLKQKTFLHTFGTFLRQLKLTTFWLRRIAIVLLMLAYKNSHVHNSRWSCERKAMK